ncbi:hypothetical protein CEXT_49201 [Caerostris extrusa]|uniref:Uncharacterized protein n=1 Tax=Caerostris extrusa TaxID=172846 RepID=A0AAV4XRE8_CAEEX|nr:hypothetical protein CEXT_49201 [Caerostris extrusa]
MDFVQERFLLGDLHPHDSTPCPKMPPPPHKQNNQVLGKTSSHSGVVITRGMENGGRTGWEDGAPAHALHPTTRSRVRAERVFGAKGALHLRHMSCRRRHDKSL